MQVTELKRYIKIIKKKMFLSPNSILLSDFRNQRLIKNNGILLQDLQSDLKQNNNF